MQVVFETLSGERLQGQFWTDKIDEKGRVWENLDVVKTWQVLHGFDIFMFFI